MSDLLPASGSPAVVLAGDWSWTVRVGVILYLGLFALALWWISGLVRAPRREDREEDA